MMSSIMISNKSSLTSVVHSTRHLNLTEPLPSSCVIDVDADSESDIIKMYLIVFGTSELSVKDGL